MKSVGIICEYNPFHNGHLYHLNKVKELYPNYTIALVLSPTFSQRGELSVINKWTKTTLALNFGVDLVIELPYPFACQSADMFAKGAIQILSKLNVEYLVFGSECNNIDTLNLLAQTQLNNKNCDILTKKYLQEGLNYPTALSRALKDLTNNVILTPNDLLGISYIKEIIKQKSSIIPITIKRTNDYHSKLSNNSIMSASGIRNKFYNNEDITKYIPDYNIELFNKNNDLFSFLKYKILSEGTSINKYQTVDEGIENRINKYILTCNSLDELIDKVKTKRYTYNKINRMFNHILCSFTKKEAKEMTDISYIRVLGFNKNGRALLNVIKNNIDIPVITNCKNINNDMLLLEHRVTNIYNLICKIDDNEIIKKPIIK